MASAERASRESGKSWRSADLLRAFALFLSFWVFLHFLWVARSIVLVAILGVLFGIALSRAVDLLERFRIKRGLGTPIVLLLVIGILIGAGSLAAPVLKRQSADLMKRLPAAVNQIESKLGRKPVGRAALEAVRNGPTAQGQTAQGQTAKSEEAKGGDAKPPTTTASGGLRPHLQTFSKMLFPFLSNSIAAIGGVIIVFFLAAYLAAEPDLYRRGVLALVPPPRRAKAAELMDELHDVLSQWLVARFLAMVVIGLMTFGGLALIGIPGAGALGLIAGIMEFLPFVGPIVSAIPALALALVVSPTKALYVLILFVALQQFEGNVLTPLLMKNRLNVPPAVTIIAVSAFGIVFGVIGMLVAEPASAAAILLVRRLYVERLEEKSEE